MRQSLTRLTTRTAEPRIALLGIGHPLNGDDAAGIAVVRALDAVLPPTDRVLLLEGGSAPENQTGRLRQFTPDLVIFIDAAQMDAAPGAVRWLDWRETTGLSASTHTLPPYMLAQFLVADLGCDVALLGIQPAHTLTGAPLSNVMQRAVDSIVQTLIGVLCQPE